MSATDVATKTKVKIKPVTLWRVVFLNDDVTPMDFVVALLVQLFHKHEDVAENIAMTIHHTGRGVINLYTEEVAKQKAIDTVQIARSNGYPLMAIAEPA